MEGGREWEYSCWKTNGNTCGMQMGAGMGMGMNEREWEEMGMKN
jgi:hypothetical protein